MSSLYIMRKFIMFITAVCVLFLIKLRWPNHKSLYFTAPSLLFPNPFYPSSHPLLAWFWSLSLPTLLVSHTPPPLLVLTLLSSYSQLPHPPLVSKPISPSSLPQLSQFQPPSIPVAFPFLNYNQFQTTCMSCVSH